MLLYQQLTIVSVLLLTVDCAVSAPQRPADAFASAVALVNANNRLDARNTLREIPDAELIRGGIAFLSENPTLPEDARQFCYEVLATRRAARSEEGYELLIDGLRDASVRRWSAAGLEQVPIERRVETVDRLITIASQQGVESPDNVIMLQLGMLGRWGESASKALPHIVEILHSDACPDLYRSLAAQALLAIGTVENVVTHFESEELRLTMGPIGAAGWSTNGTFGTDDQSVRQRFRQLVLRGLRSSDPEVRTHAFEALLPAYGVDFLVADGQGGFRANPESVEALDALAANETDASLRARAQSGLLTLDERVRKAIRKRNKRAESATPNGD